MIADRIALVIKEFSGFPHWEDRYKKLLEYGRKLEPMDSSNQIDKFKIKGCQSDVWLKPEFDGNLVSFTATSDALIVKGIVGLLVYVYSNSTPKEILDHKPDFLKEIGITEHLSLNRSNGLSSMVKQIQMYAIAFMSIGSQS